MGKEEQAQKFFTKLGAQDEHRVSDPEKRLYQAFSLQRGKFGQLFGLRIWKREIRDRMYLTYGVGRIIGDSFQLPGVFLVHHSEVIKAFRHDSIADEVNYVEMAK